MDTVSFFLINYVINCDTIAVTKQMKDIHVKLQLEVEYIWKLIIYFTYSTNRSSVSAPRNTCSLSV